MECRSSTAPGLGLNEWEVSCPAFEHTASLSAHDLTGDGVDDVIFNSPTTDKTLRQVAAIDGIDGSVLWVSDETIDMITVARFGMVNDDDVPDVVVGGRGLPDEQPFMALDGGTGELIWRVEKVEPTWQNVYTPQPLADVTDDGRPDWLIATGGDHVRPAEEPPTVPGRLAIIDGADGTVIASLAVPDDQEVYSSPIVLSPQGRDPVVLVGTGGEMFPGSMWKVPLRGLLTEDPSAFEELASGDGDSSFIAPPSAADLDLDGALDAVLLRLDGVLESRDPVTGSVNWSATPAASRLEDLGAGWGLSSLAVPAIGQLDDDPPAEIVTLHTFVKDEQFLSGQPYTGDALLAVTDGSTGALEHELFVRHADSVSSPLIVELDGLGAIVCACIETSGPPASESEDRAVSTGFGLWTPFTNELVDLGSPATVSSTPSMVDIVGDAAPRIASAGVSRQSDDDRLMISSLQLPVEGQVFRWVWGAYMGNHSDGVAPAGG